MIVLALIAAAGGAYASMSISGPPPAWVPWPPPWDTHSIFGWLFG